MNFNRKKLDSITLVLLFALTIFSLMAFTTYRSYVIPVVEIKPLPIKIIPVKIVRESFELVQPSHQQFLEAIGHRESTNNYSVVNEFGYMGRYQFGRSTLKGLGINVTKEEFINDPKLQEKAMHMLLSHNKKKLKRYIKKYEGQIIHGVLITESGVLAAAHLAGQGNVRKFLKNGFVFKDGNGTKMTSYMKQFGGYILNL
jgi:hypothetical protein|tara:strand:+ start:183 stop:782 length:600 start_codon:yes stop_codon:yes gene_type:complete